MRWPWVEAWFPRGRGSLVLALSISLSACFPPESERLSCGDVLPTGSVGFAQIESLVRSDDKGCLDSACHSAQTQEEGVRLDTSGLIYEEMSTRPDTFYALLASGEMPAGNHTRWSEDDLKLFRSWYCSGAFPP